MRAGRNHGARPAQKSLTDRSESGAGQGMVLKGNPVTGCRFGGAPGAKAMKKLIECIICHWKWWGQPGHGEICEQCMLASIHDSIGG
jgi:hypothetical protein